jgi:signal transduction protein with GAF and PtsI domain
MALVLFGAFILAALGFSWLIMLERHIGEIKGHLSQISSELREMRKERELKSPNEKVREI